MCFPHTRSFIQGAVSPNLEGVRECLHTRLLAHRPAGRALWARDERLTRPKRRARASLRSTRPYIGACPTTVVANTIVMGIPSCRSIACYAMLCYAMLAMLCFESWTRAQRNHRSPEASTRTRTKKPSIVHTRGISRISLAREEAIFTAQAVVAKLSSASRRSWGGYYYYYYLGGQAALTAGATQAALHSLILL
jgi:hypothetical protein